MSRVLPYGTHDVDEADIAAVIEVLRGDWLTTGPAVERFEAALAAAVDAPYAVACSSGTAALHMAAQAAGLGPGTTAIVPAVTFVATAAAPHLTGAGIVFADVDAETGLMTPETFTAALAAHRSAPVRATFPVHLGGNACALAEIRSIADARGIAVIDDACHALGGTYRDGEGTETSVGAARDTSMSVFSFHPVKAAAAGEGGAVTTRDAALATRLKRLRNHGIVREPNGWRRLELGLGTDGVPNPWYYEVDAPGLNYRLSDIHAALGASQLGKLARFRDRRATLAARYDAALAPLAPLVRPVPRRPGERSGWHLYAILIDFAAIGITRATLMRRLSGAGIGTQVHYIPVPWQPCWPTPAAEAAFPGAAAYYARTLTLPLFPAMAESDVDLVVEELANSLQGANTK